MMKGKYIYIVLLMMFLFGTAASAQVDKRDVRKGNRDFRKENFREADIDYRKALVKDSMSVAANYNLASTLYRQSDMEQAAKTLDRVKDTAPASASAADYWYNRGDVALAMQDYQTAVAAFGQSLIIRPDDLDAKENFIYAKKMLQNQQNNQNQDQNQDQNDQDQDQNGQNDQKQDQTQQPKISPQAAQQMLQAIQAKEKETQEKVKEQKAQALKSRQKDKNW